MSKSKKPMTAGFKSWIFGDRLRDEEGRKAQVQTAVSEAIKCLGPRTYHRYDKAKAFARRMRVKADRLRFDDKATLIDAMCMGVNSGHRWVMVRRYEAAAIAAERFCTARSR